MKTKTLYKDIKLKSGEILKKGTKVTVYPIKDNPHRCSIIYEQKKYRLRWDSVIKPPSIKTIERWCSDDVCESVFGCRIEPDGYDQFDGPSWLLVMGLI